MNTHIDAKHWAEVGRLRARVAELETELAETKAVDIEEYRRLSRLHEIATERTVQLAAENAQLRMFTPGAQEFVEAKSARDLLPVAVRQVATLTAVIERAKRETDSYNDREAGGWQAVVDRVQDVLASADTDAALSEVRAKALEDAAGYFGQNQTTIEGDVKEWLRNRAAAVREGRA